MFSALIAADGLGESANDGISDSSGAYGGMGALRKGRLTLILHIYGPRTSEYSIVNYAPK